MDVKEILYFERTATTCCSELRQFDNSLDELIGYPSGEDQDAENLRNMFNSVESNVQREVDGERKALQNWSNILKKKQMDVALVSDKLQSLKTERDIYNHEVAKITKKEKGYKIKLERLQILRDCIQAYKLLTATNFVYKAGGVLGYIKVGNSGNFEVFDFKTSEVSEMETNKSMWALLNSVQELEKQINEPIVKM